MSFDCKYKVGDGVCRRLPGGECKPGTPGCVLYGRFYFPFHDEGEGDSNRKAANTDESTTESVVDEEHDVD